jgi:hypothetical protein
MPNKLEERYIHFVHTLANIQWAEETAHDVLIRVIQNAGLLHQELLASGYGK